MKADMNAPLAVNKSIIVIHLSHDVFYLELKLSCRRAGRRRVKLQSRRATA